MPRLSIEEELMNRNSLSKEHLQRNRKTDPSLLNEEAANSGLKPNGVGLAKENRMRATLIVIAVAPFPAGAVEMPLSVPSDAKAQFFVLEKGGNGVERTIVTKRVGSSGTTYSKRLYNCRDATVKYLGTGDSIAAMNVSQPDPKMAEIVNGSIAFYVGKEACK